MTECRFLLICDYAFNDEGGRQCAIGMFEALVVDAFPVTKPTLDVAVHLTIPRPGPVTATVSVETPGGVRLDTYRVEGLATAGPVAFNVRFSDVTFAGPGWTSA